MCLRSIPAPAGEPSRWPHLSYAAGSIPAPAGEPESRTPQQHPPPGLSPRLRGNQTRVGGQPMRPRSIPAPAGEPPAKRMSWSVDSVYPRACGGTLRSGGGARRSRGLSPRLRGNQLLPVRYGVGQRSIPAPAGNLPWIAGMALPPGSIPAPAGEPRRIGRRWLVSWVYPRACGGTGLPGAGVAQQHGLSPRLRGNHAVVLRAALDRRSIPAPAGEPSRVCICRGLDLVYPRACGGTPVFRVMSAISSGLSPRLRGNRHGSLRRRAGLGSIPAPAGEPPGFGEAAHLQLVYPRACGGTTAVPTLLPLLTGLSPRLRGNRQGGR